MNEIEPLLEKARRAFDVAEATLEQGHADFATSVVIDRQRVQEVLDGGRRFLAAAASYLKPP